MHITTLNQITVLDLDGYLVIGGNQWFRQCVTRIVNSKSAAVARFTA